MGFDDWDQRLFAWVWRGVRGIGAGARRLRGEQAETLPEHALLLTEISSKLGLLAAALGGATLDIREAEEVAGYRGDTILLPGHLAVGESVAEAGQSYVLSLAYQVTSRALGLRLPRGGSPEVASWLAMGALLPRLERELPGSIELLADLKAPLLDARPAPSELSGVGLALELALRRRLDVAVEVEASAPVLGWLDAFDEACATLADVDAEHVLASLDSLTLELSAQLAALGSLDDVAPFAPFGLLRAPSTGAAFGKDELVPPSALATGTEGEGKSKEVVRSVQLDDRPHADNPLVHSFEKVHTAEEYKGGQKALDGTDELEDHLDALEELDMREVIRTRERTASIFRADALLDGAAPELDDATPDRPPDFCYDEWNHKRRRYERAYCNVYLERARKVRSAAANEWVKETLTKRRRELRRLEQELARIALERRPKRRQRDGSEVDVDAVVCARATLAAGHTPSDRLHINRLPKDPTLSLLVLLDISLSSDAFVAGERVLDVSREAAFVVGEAIGDSAQFAIAGFHSNTRRDCRFVTVKSFGERWRDVRGRLVGLEPQGYTRIGPALRHGASVLRLNHTQRRAMVVVTDGQPTDYDRYEGRHGVEDVRQAIREAGRDGVVCFALAVSKERRPQLGQMFGTDRYSLLQRASQLPDAMATLLTELVQA